MPSTLTTEMLIAPRSYASYKQLVFELAQNNSCTGEITDEHISATTINAQRIKRLDKQIILNNEIIDIVSKINKKWIWIVLIESWCGDGAQNISIISKIADLSPNIELKIVLRDQNLFLMDQHLTNGSRSIPKLICIDAESQKEIGTWGPRPKAIQEMVKEFKAKNPEISHEEFVKNLHLWYAQNKGIALQNELSILISEWSNK